MPDDLFPAFSKFVVDTGLVDRAKGNLSAKLPRILGQGTTKAVGLSLPPAPIERMMELATLALKDNLPDQVIAEIRAATEELEKQRADLSREDTRRRLVFDTFSRIPQPNGTKDGKYFAGGMILSASMGGMEWAWSITPYYPIVKKLPPDPEYIQKGFEAAQQTCQQLRMASEQFESRLELAWTMARHFTSSNDVLVVDVMRMFNIAGQDERFWQNPVRQFFKDLPVAAFVINLVHWRAQALGSDFEFVPATLHQAHGANAKVFYLPMNSEGTDVRPMIFLRKRGSASQQG